MSVETALVARSENKCELCSTSDGLQMYNVPPNSKDVAEACIYICTKCADQLENPNNIDIHHWRCLNDSMWSEVPAVQVIAWRMLNTLSSESWARDLLDMMYLEEETLAWAQSTDTAKDEDASVLHKDSNGAVLQAGDTVTLTKDLTVKGAGFTAKRGTAVRGISLVPDNPEQIEGRVSGQQIVILTRFVKK